MDGRRRSYSGTDGTEPGVQTDSSIAPPVGSLAVVVTCLIWVGRRRPAQHDLLPTGLRRTGSRGTGRRRPSTGTRWRRFARGGPRGEARAGRRRRARDQGGRPVWLA